MNTYIIEYREKEGYNQYMYISDTDADTAVKEFIKIFPQAVIVQVSKIIKKYSKKF